MEQSLNFEMLRSQWPELAELACMAERYVHTDPESCLVKLRNYTELMVRWLYQERLPEGIKANLYDLMNADVFTSMMPEAIIMKMDALRIHGNRAAHGGRIKAKDTYWLLKEAYCWEFGYMSATPTVMLITAPNYSSSINAIFRSCR
jgi:type I restriction enzyme R subunit